MAGIMILLLLAVPILELWVIIEVGSRIGVLNTIALLIAISVAGAWLLKQQGLATWLRLQQTLARGEMPNKEVTDGFLILLGGALLLTPGFLTDVVGIILLLPPTRAALKGAARKVMVGWGRKHFEGRVYSSTVVRSERKDPAPRTTPVGSLESSSAGDPEDDSPDKE